MLDQVKSILAMTLKADFFLRKLSAVCFSTEIFVGLKLGPHFLYIFFLHTSTAKKGSPVKIEREGRTTLFNLLICSQVNEKGCGFSKINLIFF